MDELKKKLFPADLAWNILNNLDKFNDKNNLITLLNEKIQTLHRHSIFGKFTDLFQEAVNYYEIHNEFPDIAYLNKKFPDGKLIKVIKGEEFSMTFYDDLLKNVEYESLIIKFTDTIARRSDIDINACLDIAKDLTRFASVHDKMPKDTRENLVNLYDTYSREFRGIKTHLKPLDDVIGVLGYQSLSVLAAPTGHGKSTFAITLAYLAATHGLNVCYTSFEVPKNHIFFNLASIESTYSKNQADWLPSSKIKSNTLDERETALFKTYMNRMFDKIEHSGGYIDVVDQTQIQCDTFEHLCTQWEDRAEQTHRKADLIIVDNVDNLQVLKSDERDESTKVNQYIIALDKYSKTYCNGTGTSIMLLTQVNRTGIKKIQSMDKPGDTEITIDVTCIQKFNALYEKATTVLVEYSSPAMRVNKSMKIMPIKLRNNALPLHPVALTVDFEHSKVCGEYEEKVNSLDEVKAKIMAGTLPPATSEPEPEDEFEPIDDDESEFN